MRQELIEVGREAHDLPGLALTVLLDATEDRSVGIHDRVLVRQLDELRLLTDDESVGGE
jgi:hypothetical protein